MKITIIGSNGFIGSHLARYYTSQNTIIEAINRHEKPILNHQYDVIIYCAGVKANFKERITDLIQAHITTLLEWLTIGTYNHFVYLSSARLYMNQATGNENLAQFSISYDDLYNQSKILGENICLATTNKCTILRPTNILGYEPNSTTFFWEILRHAQAHKTVHLLEHQDNKRDYISINYLLECIDTVIKLRATGIYNISSLKPITNADLCTHFEKLISINSIKYGAKKIYFPDISNEKINMLTKTRSASSIEVVRHITSKFAQASPYSS